MMNMNNLVTTLLSSCKNTLTKYSPCTLTPTSILNTIQVRNYKGYIPPLRPKYPFWFLRKERATYYENLTKKNREFISDTLEDTYGPKIIKHGLESYDVNSPLRNAPFKRGEWNIKSRRTGLLGKKIGVLPIWTKDGKRVVTTMIQIVDNHVIKYIPPDEYKVLKPMYPCIGRKRPNIGCLLVGAESIDPQKLTKEYCGLFTKSGLMPKKKLGRFLITSEAAVQPGTPLFVNHFQVGQHVDVRGTTIPRGFHGVMKRWGFHGQPASHGQTKTHRRPGCIGRGRNYKVQIGKRLPGHVGHKPRFARGLKVLRINTKYNVMFVTGRGIPGATNDWVYIYDTNVWRKKFNHHRQPIFPTFYPEELKEPLPEDQYSEEIFDMSQPTIMYEIPKEKKRRR